MTVKLSTLCLALAASSMSVYAQETSRSSFTGGAGFTAPVGTTGRNTDYGWNVRGGAGMNLNPHFGVMLDLGYDSMGINSGVLSSLGFGGGNLNIFSATIDPVVHLTPKRKVDLYVTGGGGLYHRHQDFTKPAAAPETGVDPFLGVLPSTSPVMSSSYSVNKPGIDAGVGVAFGHRWNGKFFAEARYNRIFAGDYHTDYLPVTFGFRW
jgi:hypothetical protein